MKKIIFLGGLNHPRTIKRITSFCNAGFVVVVYGYDRGRFQGINSLPKEIETHVLGSMTDGNRYIQKFFLLLRDIYRLTRQYRRENVCFYSFSFLPSLILSIITSKPYLYEISDVIYANFESKIGREILKILDRIIIKKSFLTVMTSQGFKEYLFPKNPPTNIHIQPNKLNNIFADIQRNPELITEKIRFAFIGWLRYDTIFRFAEIVGANFPNYSFSFFGDSDEREKAIALSEKYNNIHFYGKFRNPEDLEKIYRSIDVVVACYDTKTINERIAEPNKLYEAMFFCKPIIVSPNIFLSKQVQRYGCGLLLDASTDKSIFNFLYLLSIEELNKIVEKEVSIDKNELIDNPQKLIERIA